MYQSRYSKEMQPICTSIRASCFCSSAIFALIPAAVTGSSVVLFVFNVNCAVAFCDSVNIFFPSGSIYNCIACLKTKNIKHHNS